MFYYFWEISSIEISSRYVERRYFQRRYAECHGVPLSNMQQWLGVF